MMSYNSGVIFQLKRSRIEALSVEVVPAAADGLAAEDDGFIKINSVFWRIENLSQPLMSR